MLLLCLAGFSMLCVVTRTTRVNCARKRETQVQTCNANTELWCSYPCPCLRNRYKCPTVSILLYRCVLQTVSGMGMGMTVAAKISKTTRCNNSREFKDVVFEDVVFDNGMCLQLWLIELWLWNLRITLIIKHQILKNHILELPKQR